MKIANKVIDDRIAILDGFIEKSKDNPEPVIQINVTDAREAKGLFVQLKLAIEEHTNLLNGGLNDKDLVEKIKELVSVTMVQMVDRNKQMVEGYKQKIYNLDQKCKEIKSRVALMTADGHGPLRTELIETERMISVNEQMRTETIVYLQEYEAALEEINEFIGGKETKEVEVSDSLIEQAIDLLKQKPQPQIEQPATSPTRGTDIQDEKDEPFCPSCGGEDVKNAWCTDRWHDINKPKIYDENDGEFPV